MAQLNLKQKEILIKEAEYQFSRSSGPGGQKVNKTESQVELRWSVIQSQGITSSQRQLIEKKLENLINKEGELVLSSDQFRSRERNKQACIDNFFEHIKKALHIPKKRKPTRPTKGSVEKRIEKKKQLSEKKRNRQKW